MRSSTASKTTGRGGTDALVTHHMMADPADSPCAESEPALENRRSEVLHGTR
jgi:hypothetical protein